MLKVIERTIAVIGLLGFAILFLAVPWFVAALIQKPSPEPLKDWAFVALIALVSLTVAIGGLIVSKRLRRRLGLD
jgi:hypothetical protein